MPHHKLINRKTINILLLVLLVLIMIDDIHGWLDGVKIALIAACGVLNNRKSEK